MREAFGVCVLVGMLTRACSLQGRQLCVAQIPCQDEDDTVNIRFIDRHNGWGLAALHIAVFQGSVNSGERQRCERGWPEGRNKATWEVAVLMLRVSSNTSAVAVAFKSGKPCVQSTYPGAMRAIWSRGVGRTRDPG